jgi:CO/xanthine dehydrogenase FAD-binding subunit
MQETKEFEYYEPANLQEALRILSSHPEKRLKILAGGSDLIPALNKGSRPFEGVVYLGRIPELNYIQYNSGGSLRIGAGTTIGSLIASPVIRRDFTLLWEGASQVDSLQVRNMATVVGNLCVASPASDIAPPLVALGAQLRILSQRGERLIQVEDFFSGVKQIILQREEIVTEIIVPNISEGTQGTFMNLIRTKTDISKVNLAITLRIKDNHFAEARMALGAVAPRVIRARIAEKTLIGSSNNPDTITKAALAAVQDATPISDVRSSAEYRTKVIPILVRRGIEKILANKERYLIGGRS